MSDKPALPEPVAWLHDGRASIDKLTVLYDHERNIRCGFKPRPVVELFTAEQMLAALATQAEEVARLTAALKQVNEQFEKFERQWYLRGDEIERLTAELTEVREQLSAHDAIRAGLEAEVAKLRETNERFGKRQEWWTDRMFALEAERDALRADAERMRWIAAHCRSTAEHWGGRWSIVIDGPAPTRHDEEDALYAAIDAARTGSKP